MHIYAEDYILEIMMVVFPRNLEEGIRSLFDPCVNVIGVAAMLPVTHGGEL